MGLIDRYILRTVATPLILSLCVAAMLLLLEQMLRLFDFVLAEQGPIDVVWRMLANLLPHYLSLALPLGAFLGILLAFRNLSLSSELDALNSSGASFGRLMRPVYGLIAFLMIGDFLLVGYIQPYAGYQYRELKFDVTSGAFGITIPQGEFVRVNDDVTIRFGSIDPDTQKAQDIFLELTDSTNERTIITARSGSLSAADGLSKLILRLNTGRQMFLNEANETLRVLDFNAFDVDIDLPMSSPFRARGGEKDEATFTELWQFLNQPDARASPLYHPYRAGFHWSIIHPLTFLVMPILAVAMGVTGRRRASSLKPIVGMAILIVYHELLEEWGQVAAAQGQLSPYVSMWGLLAIFLIVSGFLYAGSIDKARLANWMARRDDKPIRVSTDGSLSAGLYDGDMPATDTIPAFKQDAALARGAGE